MRLRVKDGNLLLSEAMAFFPQAVFREDVTGVQTVGTPVDRLQIISREAMTGQEMPLPGRDL